MNQIGLPFAGTMQGIRVVELSTWAFVPSAAALLAAWGADVVKIEEPSTGDMLRGITAWGVGPTSGPAGHPLVQAFNRGKRSVGLNVASDRGREVLMRLIDRADVFVTNFLPPARIKLGIDVADVTSRKPGIIYGRGSGQGVHGPEKDKGGFDAISYWSRSSAARGAMSAGQPHPVSLPGPAFGDSQSGLNLAGGIAAALFHRQRTGEALVVDVSLLASGMWSMQGGITACGYLGLQDLPNIDRDAPPNPLVNVYGTADHQFVSLAMLEADRYWPGVCQALGRSDLQSDPRFATADLRSENRRDCVAELDAEFGRRTLIEARQALSSQTGAWDVVQTAVALHDDPQVIANEYIGYVEQQGLAPVPFVRAPIRFNDTPEPVALAPELGAHTEEVLLELGYDWDEILALKDAQTIS